MDAIKQVPSYACSLCDTLTLSPDEAAKCFVKCTKAKNKEDKLKKRKANWDANMNLLRNEARSVEDVSRLLEEHAKRFFGVTMEVLEMDVYFTDVSCSHGAPIGEKTNWGARDKKAPTSFPGWSGNIKVRWKKNGRDLNNNVVDSPSDLVDWGGIKGLHTGSGGGGGSEFEYGFYFFLQDFPKMAEMYKELKVLEKAAQDHREQDAKQCGKVRDAGLKLYDKDPGVKKRLKRIEDLNRMINDLTYEKSELEAECRATRNAYLEEMEKAKDEKWPIDSKYEFDRERLKALLKVFRGRWYCEE